ncbi:uncharacterized protein LOC106875253 [Octopus bimaculoides]|uniref:DUF7041 domain-containing protein n=1 Tax=Octopus bimaculoides TaxID=37653 RepID=A0A0L8GRH4_OCTBM|nr:uncharacterized protein LOC106875253 [Octopus bimaculoides]|eukprot:XP_014778807.1 PREDICTED: uncharacterized protein LOC106875253 [Octopus bimaculoides]
MNSSTQNYNFQAAISIKVPLFSTLDPPLWFCYIVAQFASSRITSNATRLTHIIGSLSPEILNEVRELIMAPPDTVSFDTFKTTLLTRMEESQQKRLCQLLLTEELGDKKPSQLLRQMKQLMGDDNLPNRVLKQLFRQHLPSNTQVVLTATKDSKSVVELTELADRIADVPRSCPSLSAVVTAAPPTNPFPPSTSATDLAELQALMTEQASQIQLLTTKIQALSYNRHHHSNSPVR